MSRFSGPQGGPTKAGAPSKGVLAAYKAQKRKEAEDRAEAVRQAKVKRDAEFEAASATPPQKLLMEIFGEDTDATRSN